jgi:hypothetical protein
MPFNSIGLWGKESVEMTENVQRRGVKTGTEIKHSHARTGEVLASETFIQL